MNARTSVSLYRIAGIILIFVVLAACSAIPESEASQSEAMVAAPTPVPGSPQRGQQLIINYGCGSCHTIPGIPGADTDVGPSLAGFGERRYIAGVLVNNPENLRQWILNPHEIQPGTSMPNVGVTETDVQDITAYLYTLQ